MVLREYQIASLCEFPMYFSVGVAVGVGVAPVLSPM